MPLKRRVTAQLPPAARAPSPLPRGLSLACLGRASPSRLSPWGRYLHFTEATGERQHEVAPNVSYKTNIIFSNVRRPQGVQNTTELDTRWKDCSSRILRPAKPESCLFLNRQITFHATTNFQFSLSPRH